MISESASEPLLDADHTLPRGGGGTKIGSSIGGRERRSHSSAPFSGTGRLLHTGNCKHIEVVSRIMHAIDAHYEISLFAS